MQGYVDASESDLHTMSVALEHALSAACTSEETRISIANALQNHDVLTLDDLRDVSDLQYWQMGVPVGVANRLKRSLHETGDLSVVDKARLARSSNGVCELARNEAAHNATGKLGCIELLQDKYGCKKGEVYRVKGMGNSQNASNASSVLESVDRHVSVPCSHENKGWRWTTAMDCFPRDLFAFAYECSTFLRDVAHGLANREVPRNRPINIDDIVQIPVGCLRWTHDRINSHLEFAHGDQGGQSIFKLFDELVRGVQTPQGIDEPLDVVVISSCDDVKLFSVSNRRLLPLVMYQAVTRDKTVYAKCVIRPIDAKFQDACSTGSAGLNIAPRRGESSHLGMPLFDHGRAAMKILEEVATKHPETQILDNFRLRRSGRAPSECSLTVANGDPFVEPPARRRRVDAAPIIMVVSPSLTARERASRDIWLYLEGSWSKANWLSSWRDQHLRHDMPNPQNPRHIQSGWKLKPCVFCAGGSEVVIATDSAVHRVTLNLGKNVCNRITDQPLPHVLSSMSRIATLQGDKLLILTGEIGQKLFANILTYSTKSWEQAEQPRSWMPASTLPVATAFDVVEQIGLVIYFGSLGKTLYRTSLSSGETDCLLVNPNRRHSRSCECESKQRIRAGFPLLFPWHGASAASYASKGDSLEAQLTHELASGSLIVFDGQLHEIVITATRTGTYSKAAVIEAYRTHRQVQHQPFQARIGQYLRSIKVSSDVKATIDLVCLSDQSRMRRSISRFPEDLNDSLGEPCVSNHLLTWCTILAIPLTARNGEEVFYTFFRKVMPVSCGNFFVGFASSTEGDMRCLEASSLEMPRNFQFPPCDTSKAGSFLERIEFVGSSSVALLVTQEACVQFDACTETWLPAPLVPSSSTFRDESTRFVVPNRRKGFVRNVAMDLLKPCLQELNYSLEGNFSCDEVEKELQAMVRQTVCADYVKKTSSFDEELPDFDEECI